jgi:hypothetical protein
MQRPISDPWVGLDWKPQERYEVEVWLIQMYQNYIVPMDGKPSCGEKVEQVATDNG